MLKMHQKPFGGQAPPGPAGELKRSPRALAAIWGLLLRGRGGERREGEGRASTTLSGYATDLEGLRNRDGRGKKGQGGREGGREQNWAVLSLASRGIIGPGFTYTLSLSSCDYLLASSMQDFYTTR